MWCIWMIATWSTLFCFLSSDLFDCVDMLTTIKKWFLMLQTDDDKFFLLETSLKMWLQINILLIDWQINGMTVSRLIFGSCQDKAISQVHVRMRAHKIVLQCWVLLIRFLELIQRVLLWWIKHIDICWYSPGTYRLKAYSRAVKMQGGFCWAAKKKKTTTLHCPMGVIKVQPQSSKWIVNVFRSVALGWWVELEVKSALEKRLSSQER